VTYCKARWNLRPAERAAFLDRECASNPSLRKDVDEMLSIEGKLEPDFLESPAAQQVALRTQSSLGNSKLPPGTRLGHYEVQLLLGEGGMGEMSPEQARGEDPYTRYGYLFVGCRAL
jgi:eukaryotic-like serine/threonine-protein kinase